MSQTRHILQYVTAYVLLVLSLALGLFVLYMGRETVLLSMVYAANSGDQSQGAQFYQSLRVGAVYQWSIVVVGLIAIALLVGLESYYRTAVASEALWKRFFMVSGVECGVLCVVHAIYLAYESGFHALAWTQVILPLIEALLAALFVWLAFNRPKFLQQLR